MDCCCCKLSRERCLPFLGIRSTNYVYLLLALVIVSAFYLAKQYLHAVLLWLEVQHSVVIAAAIMALFTIAALPIAVGYIVIVVACGYLFGFAQGLVFTVCGANMGLLIAHRLLKIALRPSSTDNIRNGNNTNGNSSTPMHESELVQTLLRLIGGPLAFRIVVCSRLTPVPFGLQNTIFAMSDISAKVYHLASLLGLFPAQCVAVYAGSTLRSMQDVIENRTISVETYLFACVQIILGICLLFWIGNKARKEIMNMDKNATLNNSYRIV